MIASSVSDCTGMDEDDLGGFPVNSPDYMVLEQSVNNTRKNNLRGLYSTFGKRKPSRKTNGGFINDMKKTWDNLIQEAMDLQPDIMRAIVNLIHK